MKIHKLPGGGEPRIALSATTHSPGGPITVATVHLDHLILRGLRPAKPAMVIAAPVASDHRPVLAVIALPD